MDSLGRAPVGRNDTGVTRGWTERKPWEIKIAWGESSPVGRSDNTEVTTGWTEGKPWEIAWGSSVGKERYGSDRKVDGGVGNSLGRSPWGRSETEATIGCTEEKPWEIAWGELRWEGAIWKRREGTGGGK